MYHSTCNSILNVNKMFKNLLTLMIQVNSEIESIVVFLIFIFLLKIKEILLFFQNAIRILHNRNKEKNIIILILY